MKTTTTKVKTVHEHVHVITCDLCRTRIASAADDQDEVTIEHVWGASHDVTIFDCCSACFRTRVFPALEALGLKAREESRGY